MTICLKIYKMDIEYISNNHTIEEEQQKLLQRFQAVNLLMISNHANIGMYVVSWQ